MSAWQPIGTAPDNQAVLVFVPNWDHYGPGVYRAIHVNFQGRSDPRWHSSAWACGRDFSAECQPTLWMPFPDLPSVIPAPEAAC